MKNLDPQLPSVKGPGLVRRKATYISHEGLIKTEYLQAGGFLPLVIRPNIDGVGLAAWAEGNQEYTETNLINHGGILFRGFGVKSLVEFEQFIAAISNRLLKYTYRSTPRSQESDNIYTSTDYPADQFIPLHNEMSYSSNWPMKIWFYCVTPAEQGGETPIADSRKVFERLSHKIKEKFIEKQVMYVRNYGEGLDLPWQNVFQTTSRLEVENYCRRNNIVLEWKGESRLRTRQVCQAVTVHPKTGETVWFNQAHLFHASSLEPITRESLLAVFKEEELPRNAYYGDGSPIEISVLEDIREAYRQETVTFSWQEGDILMLDNMLVAHGRRSFVGQRRILVGMAEPFADKDV